VKVDPANPPNPANVPAPVKVPEPPAQRSTYKVVAGDTFAGIARKHFGTEAAAAELQRVNPTINANRLQVGAVLQLPSKAEVERAVPGARPPATSAGTGASPTPAPAPATNARTYTVAAGDTFESISLRQLGSRSRVDELRELNANIDPTRLRIGMQIRLPKK
jgi:LysM repeat protein